MKKISITLVAVIVLMQFGHAQWTTSGGNIYNSNTGTVGIGTTSPGLKLETFGAAGVPATSGTTQTGILRLNQGSYYNVLDFGSYYTAPYGLWIQGTGSNNLASTYPIILQPNGGNVGIGTTAPGNKLDVNGTAAAPNLSANSGYASFYQSGGNARITVGGLPSGSFAGWIQTSDGAGSALPLSLQPSGGNVGVGTTSPNGKLDVNGAIVLPGSVNNTTARPAVGTSRITGEIAGYSATGLGADDGFLRLSAGGGTTAGIKSFIDLSGYSTLTDMVQNITFGTSGAERMRINSSGNVGIGTTNPGTYKLAVNGNVHAKQVNIDMTGWSDYVFKRNYVLPSLTRIKAYIDQNHHLPEIPSEQQIIKDGLNLGEMNKLLVKKVEELTLYMIEQNKQIARQQKINQSLQQQINKITKHPIR
jgi:hypothetical protein